MRTRIKFCGCTSVGDALAAVEAGADAVGVIFAAESARCVSAETGRAIARALPAFVCRVAVFVDPTEAQIADALGSGYVAQFSGSESASRCESSGLPYLKAVHVPFGSGATFDVAAFEAAAPAFAHATWMFDTAAPGQYGGTAQVFEWDLLAGLARRRSIVVCGGLTPENVGDCVRRLRPFAVDVRSGIETNGVKDHAKMRAFVRAVEEADAQA